MSSWTGVQSALARGYCRSSSQEPCENPSTLGACRFLKVLCITRVLCIIRMYRSSRRGVACEACGSNVPVDVGTSSYLKQASVQPGSQISNYAFIVQMDVCLLAEAMDAPKKFSVQKFRTAMLELSRECGVNRALPPSSEVLKRRLFLPEMTSWMSSTGAIKSLASWL